MSADPRRQNQPVGRAQRARALEESRNDTTKVRRSGTLELCYALVFRCICVLFAASIAFQPSAIVGWIVGSSFGGGSFGEPAGIGIWIGIIVGPIFASTFAWYLSRKLIPIDRQT